MPTIFSTPQMDLHDTEVVAELTATRSELQSRLRAPRRWTAGLRKTATARAIQGSNTIEGYTVSDQDASAAVEDEEPLTADERTWAEILGYRQVQLVATAVRGPRPPRMTRCSADGSSSTDWPTCETSGGSPPRTAARSRRAGCCARTICRR